MIQEEVLKMLYSEDLQHVLYVRFRRSNHPSKCINAKMSWVISLCHRMKRISRSKFNEAKKKETKKKLNLNTANNCNKDL